MLCHTDGTRGRERGAAEALAAFTVDRWPDLRWEVVPVGDPAGTCAQLVGSAGDRAGSSDLLLYSHLDTSLTSDPDIDGAITGRVDPAAPYAVDPAARTVRGFGVGVARGPAAAALVGFTRAARRHAAAHRSSGLRLLLAARGTHRAPDWDRVDEVVPPVPVTGVAALLASGAAPAAAVVAKGGPDGVLYDEPGACYLRVRCRAPWGAVMSRETLRPPGGLPVHIGTLVTAVESAGAALVAVAPASPQAGARFGIGAVRSGLPGKPDLVAGMVDLYCYLVSPGAMPSGAIAREMATLVGAALADTALTSADVTVTEAPVHPGAGTDPDHPVVRAAIEAYREVRGTTPPGVSGWTGSTDGIVLRAAGVPTVRVGPSGTVPAGDGTDVASIDELLAYARIYERIACDQKLGAGANP